MLKRADIVQWSDRCGHNLIQMGLNLLTSSLIKRSNVLLFLCIGGSRGRAEWVPPMGPNSFIFANIFAKKHPRQGSMPLPHWVYAPHPPPLWEILDPPLQRFGEQTYCLRPSESKESRNCPASIFIGWFTCIEVSKYYDVFNFKSISWINLSIKEACVEFCGGGW